MGGGRGGGWGGMRSMRQDRAVLQHRVKKGTARRMLTFAVPYKKILAIFLPVVILDAVIAAINPLFLRSLDRQRDLEEGRATSSSRSPSWLRRLALFDAGLALTERRISAYIGEYLIYDMRAKVFRHIQRMPLAFFTRTQTGALVSRLNNDVIGAQQAFTDLLSNVVGNLVTVLIVVGVMFFLSWQITLAALILLPLFLIPARFVGQRIGSLTKEGYNLNSEMNMVMQERFNVGGRHAGQALRAAPRPRHEAFEAKAGRVRDIGIAQATYARIFFVALTLTASLATAIVYGVGGVAAVHGALAVGTVVALTSYLTRLYGPLTQLSNLNLDVMTALVSFERLFEVLDIVPMIEEAPDAVASPAARLDRVRPRSTSPTRAPRRSRWLRSSRWPSSRPAHAARSSTTSPSRVEPGQMVALVGPPAPARPRSRRWSRASTTSPTARCASTASTSATPRRRRFVTQSAS